MLFPTFGFTFFFLAVFIGFWYVFRRSFERRIFLIAASYLFYSFWDWRFCVLLLISTGVNYGFGLLVGTNRDHIWRKTFLVLSVVFNLLFLGFFKYYNFFADSANGLIQYFSASSASGSSGSSSFLFPILSVILPVGISFYTFKTMSYIFDVYLCKIPAVRSFLDVMLYVSFFPQLASGPIVHAKDFFPQLESNLASGVDPYAKPIEFNRASMLIMSGMLKKMVFANFLSTLLCDPVFADPSRYHSMEVLLATIGYSVVMYCDFSGYSDMAIGVALLLGFKTPANFNRPYCSFSVTEFWKRWHITFSSWLREYLYFSMGGSRFGLVHTLVALFFTMILGGLWHGASITFIVWGAMQGLALVLERAFNYGNKRNANIIITAIQVLVTFAFTTISWIVFRSANLEEVRTLFQSSGNFSAGITLLTPVVWILLVTGLLMHAIPDKMRADGFEIWCAIPLPVKGILIALFFVLLSVVSMSGIAPFIYFQF